MTNEWQFGKTNCLGRIADYIRRSVWIGEEQTEIYLPWRAHSAVRLTHGNDECYFTNNISTAFFNTIKH